MKRVGVHFLKLVFAPFSNQEGEWFWRDQEMRDLLSKSKLYMIGQRREVFFRNLSGSADGNLLTFDIECGDDVIRNVELPASQFSEGPNVLEFLCGEKIINIYKIDEANETRTLIQWFTPDKLLYYYWKKRLLARNLEEFRRFTRFKLYYVGISKEQDSFSRLFKTAHEKRSRILGNERQFSDKARLSDELTLFLFSVTDLQINTSGAEDEIPDDFFSGFRVPVEVMTADAEKALVKILQTKYNTIKFRNYPEGRDGLQGVPYDHYSFFIEEDIEFDSGTDTIRGASTMFTTDPTLSPDWICIENGSVTLVKGV